MEEGALFLTERPFAESYRGHREALVVRQLAKQQMRSPFSPGSSLMSPKAGFDLGAASGRTASPVLILSYAQPSQIFRHQLNSQPRLTSTPLISVTVRHRAEHAPQT